VQNHASFVLKFSNFCNVNGKCLPKFGRRRLTAAADTSNTHDRKKTVPNVYMNHF